MRPIDADALPSALFQKHVHDEEELEPMLYFEDAVKVVENAPTIPAIPVEWLNEKFMDLQNKDKALSRAAWLVLYAWQKEQEAR